MEAAGLGSGEPNEDSEELMRIIQADSRSGGPDERLVAWIAADASVIRNLQRDVWTDFETYLLILAMCVPGTLCGCPMYPCAFTRGGLTELCFRRKVLAKAVRHVYVKTALNDGQSGYGYATINWKTRSVFAYHADTPTSSIGLYEMAGDDWTVDEVNWFEFGGMQDFYTVRPRTLPTGPLWYRFCNGCCCAESTRVAFAASRELQLWFVSPASFDETLRAAGAVAPGVPRAVTMSRSGPIDNLTVATSPSLAE